MAILLVMVAGFVGVALGQQDCSTIDVPTHVDSEETLALFRCSQPSYDPDRSAGRGGE